MLPLNVPNPKQHNARTAESWYGYYAGFSPDFVEAVLSQIGSGPTAVIADAWNGAGTTTWATAKRNLAVRGFDLNPVMVEIARGRLMPACRRDSVERATKVAARAGRASERGRSDPLSVWFGPVSASAFRRIAGRIQEQPDALVRGFLFTALMAAGRELTSDLRSANPTWTKAPKRRLAPGADSVSGSFEAEVNRRLSRDASAWVGCHEPAPRVDRADAAAVPLSDASVDAVITSPPYCTRIDYARNTAVELAVLGVAESDAESLRARLTGTTSVRAASTVPAGAGPRATQLLSAIRAHSSKASASYYWKTFAQYFTDIVAAIRDANRYLRPGAAAVFVVQDSWYKELHVDLAAILSEIAAEHGWRVVARRDFPVRRSMRSVNTQSRRYRSASDSNESVIWFQTQGSGSCPTPHTPVKT